MKKVKEESTETSTETLAETSTETPAVPSNYAAVESESSDQDVVTEVADSGYATYTNVLQDETKPEVTMPEELPVVVQDTPPENEPEVTMPEPLAKVDVEEVTKSVDTVTITTPYSRKHEERTFAPGYYFLVKDDQKLLVSYYYNNQLQTEGFGFLTQDGGGFLPIYDLHNNFTVIPVEVKEIL